MDKHRERIELIEKYYQGALSEAERIDFEARLLVDKALATDAEAYKKLINAFRVYGRRKTIKNRLEKIHSQVQKGIDTSPVRSAKVRMLLADKKVWGAAASIALVISIGTYLVMNFVSSLNGKDKAYYRELRRDLERVKSSQNKIIKELNEDKVIEAQASIGGTAIAISETGYILTSYHIIKNVKTVFIENKKFNTLKLKIVHIDPKLDLAIMRVEDDSFKTFGVLPYTFRKTDMDLGEKVYTLGYPKQDVVYGEGYISSINGYDGDTTSYQIAVPVNPGQSGGPLFDEFGNLVGIVSGKHTENESSAFALKAGYLRKSILENDSLNTSILLPKVNYLKNQGKIQMIKRVQDYVFEVRAYK